MCIGCDDRIECSKEIRTQRRTATSREETKPNKLVSIRAYSKSIKVCRLWQNTKIKEDRTLHEYQTCYLAVGWKYDNDSHDFQAAIILNDCIGNDFNCQCEYSPMDPFHFLAVTAEENTIVHVTTCMMKQFIVFTADDLAMVNILCMHAKIH